MPATDSRVVLLALCGALLAACAEPPPPVVRTSTPEELDPAVRRLVGRLADEAEAAPRSAEARGRLGLGYEANLLWREAQASFEQAIPLEEGDPWVWELHRAIVLREAGETRQALEQLRQVVDERPESSAARQRLGLALLELGDAAGAVEAFEAVMELEPGEAAGYLGAGEARLLLGEPRVAADLLEKAVELSADPAQARYRLGLAYRALGREEEAASALALGLEGEPELLRDPRSSALREYTVYLAARLERAAKLLESERLDKASTLLEICLDDHPERPTVLNTLALTRLAQDRPDEARELLDRSLAADPEYFETHLILASWATRTGRIALALEETGRAVEAAPGNAAPHTARSQALVAAGRYGEAAASLERALELEVRDPRIYLALGVLYEGTERWSDALALYRRSLERWPALVPAWLGVARTSLALGDTEKAREAVDAALRLDSGHPEAHLLALRLEEEEG